MEEILSEIKIKQEERISVYLTLIALYILREEFDDQRDEWYQNSKKARDFLKKAGVRKAADKLISKFKLQIKEWRKKALSQNYTDDIELLVRFSLKIIE